MKFTCEITIKLSRQKVIELFLDDINRPFWQDNYIKIDRYEGAPWAVGSRARIHYRHRTGEFILEERILFNDLPIAVGGEYKVPQMTNTMTNFFEKTDTDTTRWIAVIEYTYFKGWLNRIIFPLMKKQFKKQTQKWLDQFKTFAEKKSD